MKKIDEKIENFTRILEFMKKIQKQLQKEKQTV